MPRVPLQKGEDLKTIIFKLGENNIDAINILKKITLSKMDDVSLMLCLLSLDDMNIRGKQIIAGFKHCNSNIKSFTFAILIRAEDLITAINEACPEEIAYKSMHERKKFGESIPERFNSQYFRNIIEAIGPYKVVQIYNDMSSIYEYAHEIEDTLQFLMIKKAFDLDEKNNGNIPVGLTKEMSPKYMCLELTGNTNIYIDLETGLKTIVL